MRALLAAAVLLAFVLSGCAEGGGDDGNGGDDDGGADGGNGDGSSSGGGSAPVPHVGDKWVIKSSASGAESTITTEIKAFETHDGVEAVRSESTSSTTVSGSTTDTHSVSWSRKSDMASLEVQTTVHGSFSGYNFDSTSTTKFDPPCEGLQYPLTVGAEWDRTCTSTTTSSSGGGSSGPTTTTTHYKIEGRESVTVPAGTYNAFKITQSSGDDPASTVWMAAGCEGAVKTMTQGQGGSATAELQSVEC